MNQIWDKCLAHEPFPNQFWLDCSHATAFGSPASDQEIGVKTVIGEETLLYQQCFEGACEGDTGQDGLEPCERSLLDKCLTPRKIAMAPATHYAGRRLRTPHGGPKSP